MKQATYRGVFYLLTPFSILTRIEVNEAIPALAVYFDNPDLSVSSRGSKLMKQYGENEYVEKTVLSVSSRGSKLMKQAFALSPDDAIHKAIVSSRGSKLMKQAGSPGIGTKATSALYPHADRS